MRRIVLSMVLVMSGCVGSNDGYRGPFDSASDHVDAQDGVDVDDGVGADGGGWTQDSSPAEALARVEDGGDAGDGLDVADSVYAEDGLDAVVDSVYAEDGLDAVVDSVDAEDGLDVADSVYAEDGLDVADSAYAEDGLDVADSVYAEDGLDAVVDSFVPSVVDVVVPPPVPPAVLSITPGLGALLSEGDVLVITFSEPINTALMPAAFVSSPIGTLQPTFTWSADSKTVTIDPRITYPTGESPEAGTFSFKILELLRDIDGEALPTSVSRSYSLRYRRFTRVLPYDRELSGNVLQGDNRRYTYLTVALNGRALEDGYASFDMSSLPEGIAAFEQATLTTDVDALSESDAPTKIGAIGVEDVVFTNWVPADLTSLQGRSIGVLSPLSMPVGEGTVYELGVTRRLSDDYINRISRGNRTQFRFRASGVPNGELNRIRFQREHTFVRVSWLAP